MPGAVHVRSPQQRFGDRLPHQRRQSPLGGVERDQRGRNRGPGEIELFDSDSRDPLTSVTITTNGGLEVNESSPTASATRSGDQTRRDRGFRHGHPHRCLRPTRRDRHWSHRQRGCTGRGQTDRGDSPFTRIGGDRNSRQRRWSRTTHASTRRWPRGGRPATSAGVTVEVTATDTIGNAYTGAGPSDSPTTLVVDTRQGPLQVLVSTTEGRGAIEVRASSLVTMPLRVGQTVKGADPRSGRRRCLRRHAGRRVTHGLGISVPIARRASRRHRPNGISIGHRRRFGGRTEHVRTRRAQLFHIVVSSFEGTTGDFELALTQSTSP